MSGHLPMTGRVCVVTGATSGIGYVTARELARAGASVAVVGREPVRLSETVASFRRTTGRAEVRGFSCDLFLQSDVRRLALELSDAYSSVHVLVNNAGAIFSKRSTTAEGIERTWALNVVTPFLLTRLLLPRLIEGAPARVVQVASAAHGRARLDLDDLQGERHYSGYGAYSRSKLALILLTHEFARRFAGNRITVNALHPGFVATRFGRNNPGGFGTVVHALSFLFGIRPERGAQTSIFLATDPSVEGVTGKYYVRGRAVASSARSYDPATAERLWDVLCVQTGLPVDPPRRQA